MDAINSPTPEQDAEEALRHSIKSLKLALNSFEVLVDRIGALDETLKDSEVSRPIVRLKEAFHTLNRERHRFEAEVNGRSGPFICEPIDFEAARDEVGRLLDHLRAASDTGGVSGEPRT